MIQAVENFKNCIGSGLAAVPQPELQAWAEERASSYAAWAIEQLRGGLHGMEAAMELATWWDSHPRNPLNSQA